MFYVELVAAAYLVLIGSIMDTSNFRSAVLFRFMPIMFGIGIGFDALTRMGVL